MASAEAPSAAAATLMHQSSRNGLQQKAVFSPAAGSSFPKEKNGFAKLFLKYCCCGANDGIDGKEAYRNISNSQTQTIDKSLLLPNASGEDSGKTCLVLDLDETLVHSTFKPVPNPDYVLPIEIEGTVYNIYVLKRPGVDIFLEELGNLFEIVIFTASLSKYADPLLDLLDQKKVIKHRLFREACTFHEGIYVKDLSRIGRELSRSIIVDNAATSYLFQPENAIGISTFIDDPADRELFYCLDFLKMVAPKTTPLDDLPGYQEYIRRAAEDYENKKE